MNNDEARDALIVVRNAANAVINQLNRYVEEADNRLAVAKASEMTSIKALATDAGVDLSNWDGTPAPEPEPEP